MRWISHWGILCCDVFLQQSTFRWIFPLDYLSLFYRREQKGALAASGRVGAGAAQGKKRRKVGCPQVEGGASL
jgi:hypothetical protein